MNEKAKNEWYIVIIPFYWGGGPTIEEAERELAEAGGEIGDKKKVYRFTSELPFAPPSRDANENEADAFVDRMGALNWVRCEREDL